MKSDDSLIRRKNLRRLMAERKWATADLQPKLQYGRYTYWRDLLEEGSSKSFGEKAARRIEEAAGLPRGWLDTSDAAVPAANDASSENLLPLQDGESDLLASWRLLSVKDRQQIQTQIDQVLLATNQPVIDAMKRVGAHKRVSDEVMMRALGNLPRPAPREIQEGAPQPAQQPRAKKVAR